MTDNRKLELGIAVAGFGLAEVDYISDTIILDERAGEMFELPFDVAVPRSALHDRIHLDDRVKVVSDVERMLSGEGEAFVDIDHRVTHQNGSTRWLSARKQVQYVNDGHAGKKRPVSGLVAMLDITSHKHLVETQQLSLQEFHHRFRNMLGVVQSIVRQSANTPDEKQFAERITGRIAGLAHNAGDLVATDGRSALLLALVEAHMDAFVGDRPDCITFGGPELVVDSRVSQAIGMALHELATNAAKYGALSVPAGSVSIEWTADAQKDVFCMNWTEKNGPKVTPPSRIGFGRKVLEHMAAQTTEGHVELNYAETGLNWNLRAPLSKIGSIVR